ncbi:MAG: YetF domain-containing protein [Bryobacteraceae bacterium]
MLSHILDIPIPIYEKIVRSVLVYFFLILILRLFGKRELAQLNPFDLIVLLMLSNTVQNAIIGDDNSVTGGIIGATSLLFANFAVVRILFRYPSLDRLLGGSPTILIQNGKPDEEALRQEHLTLPELRMAANRQGIDDLREVSCGELQPNGAFSFEKHHTTRAEQQRADVGAKIDALTLRIDQLLQRKQ